ncbi:MAG: hypothetical protein VX822_01700 [Candidatus Neomarinimicrobiota bacterium]|nr:hypothetical protein [Candidatus Neomarinimicrobiota bacterium]
MPESYRKVSVQPYVGAMTEDEIGKHLLGKDAYRRTEYIILEQSGNCSIAMISRPDNESLFSPIEEISLVALPTTCVLTEDSKVDTANNTALAAKAKELGLGKESTLVVRGQNDHVNFIHHPNPVRLRVVEVVPPSPPKLLHMVQHVLTYADLPAIEIDAHQIDLRDLAGKAENAEAFLVPCRSSGLNFEVPTYFLDEHPNRHNWTLLGCERSCQIHEHFYGDRPTCVEICPRVLTSDNGAFQVIKCCLLEEHFEMDGHRAVVPWGANLRQVEHALVKLLAVDE